MFQQYNLCSLSCNDAIDDRLDPVNLVTWFIAVDSPSFVALNEVCLSQVRNLFANTEMTGYAFNTSKFTQENDDLSCPEDDEGLRRFGNAIMVHDPFVGEPFFDHFEEQEDSDCSPQPDPAGGNECRSVTCVRADTATQDKVGCSSHLENSDSIAEGQSEEYYELASGFSGTLSPNIAGDFNLVTEDIQAAVTSNCTADAPDHHYTHSILDDTLTRKIDFVWQCLISLPPPNIPQPRERSCPTGYSDHCYIFAQLPRPTLGIDETVEVD